MSNDQSRAQKHADLLRQLDDGVKLAKQMHQQMSRAFPAAADQVTCELMNLSTQERELLGDERAAQLQEVAFKLNPERAMDLLEATLCTDAASREAATQLLSRCSVLPKP